MKILFVSLGCDKNRVDSEKMLGSLNRYGFDVTDEEKEADAVVVNTCCFISEAKEESIRTILEMAELKKTGKAKALIVTGCLAERYRDEILKEIPEADAVLSVNDEDRIAETLCSLLMTEKGKYPAVTKEEPSDRIVTTGSYAYLKIAEGCDKNCTYCVIPSLRGHYRSVPMEALTEEAASLVRGGVTELILVAQETTLYGTDLYGKKSLHILLKRLCRIPHLHWIRILYCYPEEIYPELIETIRKEKKICRYLDLPIQHCSSDILKRMNRRTTKEDLIRIIGELRAGIPGIVLRTTLISGFPGETEEEHEELLGFIREMRFDRLGVFPYSREEGTPAAKMKRQIPQRIRKQRVRELMEAQQVVSGMLGAKRIGTTVEAVVEGFLPDEDVCAGRTVFDTPEVDGYIFIKSKKERLSGEYLKVKITQASEYDLEGVPLNESAK